MSLCGLQCEKNRFKLTDVHGVHNFGGHQSLHTGNDAPQLSLG